ncbi:serine/threonine phosphatase PPP [Cutibacterium acnes JCM 18909]|nr:serine/threonine phosphatase PPP [Cutibacterium acnes JCM 18909]
MRYAPVDSMTRHRRHWLWPVVILAFVAVVVGGIFLALAPTSTPSTTLVPTTTQ